MLSAISTARLYIRLASCAYSVQVSHLENYRYTVVQLRPKRNLLHMNNIRVYTPVRPMRNFLLWVRQIFQCHFWPHRRYCHVILGLQLLRKCDVISIFQDGGRGRSTLLPVSYLLMSLPSESQNLSTNQIIFVDINYINLWLRYNDFWFWKTNVHHTRILLPVVVRIWGFKPRLGLFKRFIRLREYPILKPILG